MEKKDAQFLRRKREAKKGSPCQQAGAEPAIFRNRGSAGWGDSRGRSDWKGKAGKGKTGDQGRDGVCQSSDRHPQNKLEEGLKKRREISKRRKGKESEEPLN